MPHLEKLRLHGDRWIDVKGLLKTDSVLLHADAQVAQNPEIRCESAEWIGVEIAFVCLLVARNPNLRTFKVPIGTVSRVPTSNNI